MSLSDKIYIPKNSSEEDFELNGLVPVTPIKEAVKELISYLQINVWCEDPKCNQCNADRKAIIKIFGKKLK